MIWLDKFSFPLEKIKGRWFSNTLRFIIHVDIVKSFRQKGRWQRVNGYGLVDTWCRYDNSVSDGDCK
jgi:hypothetical protein